MALDGATLTMAFNDRFQPQSGPRNTEGMTSSLESEQALQLLCEDPLSLFSSDWAEAMSPTEAELKGIGQRLASLRVQQASSSTEAFLPVAERIFAAFALPMAHVRAVILGQDPYPTPGHAIGLAFAVSRTVRPLPRSLHNIYTELHEDLDIPPATTGDLSPWVDQGVLLLNRHLTVAPGAPGSHAHLGWDRITEHAISKLIESRMRSKSPAPIAVLWGKQAAQAAPLFGSAPTVISPHPSPLSARRGFFGSRPFSTVNSILRNQGVAPIDWRLH